ncbi:MAG: FtsX-like permease family protein [Ruminococcus sp.]|nr:FtsX-like permease family protein [Ruminococcus sp.]
MKSLAVKNLKGRSVRTAVLMTLAALLSFTVLGGTLVVRSLDKGLVSLKARLGADVMVVPKEATMKKKFEDMILQGTTGYFYMDMSRAEEVMEREGVGQVSPQFFLASTSSSCCSIPVQLIGFEPETDFTVSPWIKRTYGGQLGFCDIVAGSDLNVFVGDKLSFYGVECTVAAKLEKTGTSYDTTVFASGETVKELIRSSLEKGMNDFADIDPERSVSCLMINAADGTSPEELVNDINIHVKKVKAYKTGDMIKGISDSLGGVSRMIGLLIAAVWVLGIVILSLAFTMSVNERRKEFAVLRVIGASRGSLAGLVLKEALLTCTLGSLAGAALGLLVLLPFNGFIEETLALPFLLPGVGSIAGFTAGAVILSVLSGAAAAAISALRVSRIDTGLILRGDN